MYGTGLDSLTMEPVPVVRDLREKRRMKALLYWWDPEQHALAREALVQAGRRDLIGHAQSCLIPPDRSGARRSPPRRGPGAAPAATARARKP